MCSREEIIWEEASKEKEVRMLTDLYWRHMQAFREKNEPLRKRYFDLISEFEWAFPDAANEFQNRYGK